ncbi:MAG: tyrosine-type recombinase/integrase [Flavobacteriaceae bacterium]|nr:tyrosine-type recombinase/integrase [Flavobacteriaceae bacterium]
MHLPKFKEYLAIECHYSNHTVVAYMTDLKEFQEFLIEKDLCSVQKKDIKNFLAKMLSANLSERSINRKLSAIRSFYNFLLITNTITASPVQGIKSLKFYKKAQIPYSKQEMSNVLDENVYPETFSGIRDRAIIEMLYMTGIRKSELIDLKPADINLGKKEIKVLGKGNKERIIPINDRLVQSLKVYNEAVASQGVKQVATYFFSPRHKRLNPKFVYNMVNSYLSMVTEKQKKSPHMIRHTFASHLLQNGAEINSVKEILGHANLSATQIYTHQDIEQLKKVFNMAHPRESK